MTKEEFAARVTALNGTLYRVSCGLLRCEADREDAVQEAILRAWEKLPTLRQEEFFETWTVRILINVCRTIGRRKKGIIFLDEMPVESGTVPPETRALRDAVLALPETLRLPVVLHYIEGYGVEETAKILGVPSGTVKSRLYRARNLLRKELEEAEIL